MKKERRVERNKLKKERKEGQKKRRLEESNIWSLTE